jgi:16S rRNA (guanine966-N2)-methyltransferase
MRTQLRIVAGSLRGRKLSCTVNPSLRPTPQMVREALFSILGNAVPGRPFFDVFAGTGVNGLEALSRGARSATFVERDFKLVAELEGHIKKFGVSAQCSMIRADVYRWAAHGLMPAVPVTVFLSPPFADYKDQAENLWTAIGVLQKRVHTESVLCVQAERGVALDGLPRRAEWDERNYGRNSLLFWVKEEGLLNPNMDAVEGTNGNGDQNTPES